MKIRKNAVSGSFYPNNTKELLGYFEHFNAIAQERNLNIDTPKAIISPHAGYIYSGFTANEVYRCIKNKNFKRIVVIGPSHRLFIEGASIALYDEIETPLSNLRVDLDYSHELKREFNTLQFNPLAHAEHSTETQMPFLKNYFPNTPVVEIVYGKIDYLQLCNIISYIMLESDSFVVISTDLSHFYSQEDANYLDSIFLQAIQNLDIDKLDAGCEACGMIGVKAITKYAIDNTLKTQIIDYRTSMEVTGDASRVVGYTSVLIGK
jgi:AmmeMemoRadiSam system protein B